MPRQVQQEKIFEEKFVFKYNGDLEYIDFDTLYVSQLHFTEFLKSLKASLAPEGELKIKVRTREPSSFPIELALYIEDSGKLIKPVIDQIYQAGGFLGAVYALMRFFKWLAGRKPTKEEKRGDITIVYINDISFEINTHVYEAAKSNPQIRKDLSKTFQQIESDGDVTGIEIIDKDEKSVGEVLREDFQNFEIDQLDAIVDKTENRKIQEEVNVNLSVFKVVFEKGFRWQFIYKGNKIPAIIRDDRFIEAVTSGRERFASGDVLVVNMQVHQEYDRIADAFINDYYTITKVIRHIPRSEQGTLDL